MYACMYVRTYVCMYACMYVCAYILYLLIVLPNRKNNSPDFGMRAAEVSRGQNTSERSFWIARFRCLQRCHQNMAGKSIINARFNEKTIGKP